MSYVCTLIGKVTKMGRAPSGAFSMVRCLLGVARVAVVTHHGRRRACRAEFVGIGEGHAEEVLCVELVMDGGVEEDVAHAGIAGRPALAAGAREAEEGALLLVQMLGHVFGDAVGEALEEE